MRAQSFRNQQDVASRNAELESHYLSGDSRSKLVKIVSKSPSQLHFRGPCSKYEELKVLLLLGFFFHQGSHREVYQEFQPSYGVFRKWCQGLFRPQVSCTPSLHCPIKFYFRRKSAAAPDKKRLCSR